MFSIPANHIRHRIGPLQRAITIVALAVAMLVCGPARADPQTVAQSTSQSMADTVFDTVFDNGKLLLTNGVSTIEGSAGGGLASWATIPGMETDHGVGLSAFATGVALRDFTLETHGIGIGVRNRVALTYARENFNTLSAGAALGLGHGYTFHQDIVTARVRLAGDVVYGPAWLPQITIGADFKHNLNGAVVRAVGARQSAGTDFTLAATKLVLGGSVLINTTFRLTNANQFGLLGFGGDRHAARSGQGEASVAYQLSRRLVVGGELRTRPDNLGFARETGAHDVFVAWAPTRHATLTAAFVDIGPVATLRPQRGAYLSLQIAC